MKCVNYLNIIADLAHPLKAVLYLLVPSLLTPPIWTQKVQYQCPCARYYRAASEDPY